MGKAGRTVWVEIWLWCLLGLGVSAGSAAPEALIVNLYRGEINGMLFSAMTANTIRSMLGPPSAIEAPETPKEGQDAHLQYHALGLAFSMHQPSGQAPLQCWRVSIYLTNTRDDKAGTFFLPFSGRLSKHVSRDWNPQRIATEFRQWYPQSYSQEQAAGLMNGHQTAQASPGEYRILYFELSGFRIDFFYHQTEQLLHSIHLTLHRSVKPEQR